MLIDNFRMSNASTNIPSQKEDRDKRPNSKAKISSMPQSLHHSPRAVKKKSTKQTIATDDIKDEFGITAKLRRAIYKKYDVIELVGNGSYGCVSQAKCRITGKMVALKIMKN